VLIFSCYTIIYISTRYLKITIHYEHPALKMPNTYHKFFYHFFCAYFYLLYDHLHRYRYRYLKITSHYEVIKQLKPRGFYFFCLLIERRILEAQNLHQAIYKNDQPVLGKGAEQKTWAPSVTVDGIMVSTVPRSETVLSNF
jgi:hypothetical protein